VSTRFKKQEIELLFKKALDAATTECGLPPVVDVCLFDYKIMLCQLEIQNDSRKPREVGIETNGMGKIICRDRQHCVALLRRLSSVPVSIRVARDSGTMAGRLKGTQKDMIQKIGRGSCLHGKSFGFRTYDGSIL
jgi:hypothetical protein